MDIQVLIAKFLAVDNDNIICSLKSDTSVVLNDLAGNKAASVGDL